mmetsp:Transcript_17871/g.30203  ORF Transcript_17871/g.30203 Transcript_17871/m.30203 type:complete len:203 (+) Transcript_17871:658-1266(+)
MSVMNKNEIELRIEALKATGVSNGAERTDGLWIILHENARAKKSYSDAIPLRELLGNGDGAVSEESMKQHFGGQWRGKFIKQRGIGKGFINRAMNSCVFVSIEIDDGTARNDFPNSGNIIKRGDTEVGAVHHFIKTVVTSSKEDGASADAGAEAVDEDAVDMEENDVTIGGMDGKMLRNVFQSFRVNTQSHQNDQRQAPDSN